MGVVVGPCRHDDRLDKGETGRESDESKASEAAIISPEYGNWAAGSHYTEQPNRRELHGQVHTQTHTLIWDRGLVPWFEPGSLPQPCMDGEIGLNSDFAVDTTGAAETRAGRNKSKDKPRRQGYLWRTLE